MKRILCVLAALSLCLIPMSLYAQQSQDFGEYVVHYNALNTNLIPPQVAQAYGIKRSPSRALLNITVLKKVMDNPGTPVKAEIATTATNLTGQRRQIGLREILEPEGAVYYVAELPVNNMETLRFEIEIRIEGEREPLMVKFKQQFYTE